MATIAIACLIPLSIKRPVGGYSAAADSLSQQAQQLVLAVGMFRLEAA